MNLRTVLALGHNDNRLFLKDKSGYAWLFVIPFLFVFFFGQASKDDGNNPVNPKPTVLIDNRDEGFLAQALIDELNAQGMNTVLPEDEIADQVKRGLRFPAGFTQNILDLKKADVELFTLADGSVQLNKMVEVRLTRAIIAVTSRLIELSANQPAVIDAQQLEILASREYPIPLDISYAGKRAMPSGFSQSLPGMLVMCLLMNLLTFGGASISEERSNGLLKRLSIQPMTRLELILGKIYGRFMLAMVQLIAYLAAAVFIFKIPYDGNVSALVVTLLVYSWGCAALGVFLGSVILSPEKVSSVGVLLSLVMAALSGCWWPLELSPQFMKQIATVFPTTWTMNILHQLISFGGGWSQIIGNLLLLAGFSVVSTLLAARFLRVT